MVIGFLLFFGLVLAVGALLMGYSPGQMLFLALAVFLAPLALLVAQSMEEGE